MIALYLSKLKYMKQKILDILELGLKDDAKSFYSNEEKAEMILELINQTAKHKR